VKKAALGAIYLVLVSVLLVVIGMLMWEAFNMSCAEAMQIQARHQKCSNVERCFFTTEDAERQLLADKVLLGRCR